MAVSAMDVQKLRKMTDAGFVDCKKALEETGGNIEKAVEFLRKSGLAKAQKKLDREAGEGRVFSYIHSNQKIGVLLEIYCETDFVANTPDFQKLGHDIAMHIAAESPIGITREDIPEEIVNKEKDIFKEQALKTGKPENVIDKIIEGRVDKFFKEQVLMEQGFVKDPDQTVEELVKSFIGKVGENIQITSFHRIAIGG